MGGINDTEEIDKERKARKKSIVPNTVNQQTSITNRGDRQQQTIAPTNQKNKNKNDRN